MKIPKEGKILGKVSKNDLPDGLVAVIYFCPVCGGKHTYGSDYFVQVGNPTACPNCATNFVQNDQVHHYDDESDDTLRMKRDDLHRARGEKIPIETKPDSPEKIKQARIADLENEILALKGQGGLGIKLGP